MTTIMVNEETDLISLREAARALMIERINLHYYLKVLGLKSRKFAFDANGYLSLQEFNRVKELLEEKSRREAKSK